MKFIAILILMNFTLSFLAGMWIVESRRGEFLRFKPKVWLFLPSLATAGFVSSFFAMRFL